MNAALLLDHLLTHPRYPELVRALRAADRGHLVDQIDAATTDASGTLTELGRLVGSPGPCGLDPGEVPGWVRLGALDAFTSFAESRADTCLHNPSAASPEPVVAAAWRPGLVVCRACTHLFATVDADADATCDGCGHRCAGPAQGDPIYPSMVQLGPLLYQFGACTGCGLDLASRTTATEPAASSGVRPVVRRGARGSRGRGRGRGGRR